MTRTMSDMARYWSGVVAGNWIVLAWLVIWLVNASMNALMGYETAGGEWPMTWLYAAVFFAVAAIGAWAASQLSEAEGARRGWLVMIVCAQLVFGQNAGWQTLGLSFERNAGSLENAALSRNTLKDEIERKRAKRAELGTVVTIEAATARRNAECERTSRRYPDGDGPLCKEWKAKLADAEKAIALDKEIPELVVKLGSGAKISDATALYGVPATIATRVLTWWKKDGAEHVVTADDVRFAWLVFVVFLLEVIATLGPWLMGVQSPRESHAPFDDAARFDPGELPGVPRRLPAPPVHRQITAANDVAGGLHVGGVPSPADGPLGGGGSGNVNNIYVTGQAQPQQRLPPRVAARRAGVM